jgi:hypothetical protein
MDQAAVDGTLAGLVLLIAGVLGRLVYRLDRDLTQLRERVAHLEGRKGHDDEQP